MKHSLEKVLKQRELSIFIVTLLISLLFGTINPSFFSIENIMDLIKLNSVLFISALGMLFIFLSGGIDVSIASALALNTMLGGYFLVNYSQSIIFLLVINVIVGIIISSINGFIIVRYKIPAIVMSLGMLSILFGILLYVSNGNWITGFPKGFIDFGKYRYFDKIMGIPVQFTFVIVSLLLTFMILNYTILGRSIYALGGNSLSAERFGVNTAKTLFLVYVCQGFFQGIAAFTHSTIVGQADPNAFIGFELEVIAAVVIGGVSIHGGKGRVVNIVAGTLFIAIMNNGLTLARIPTLYQKIALGIAIISSVTIDQIQNNIRQNNAARIDVEEEEMLL